MSFPMKLLLSNVVIISCVLIGKRFPTLSGLIAAMPLTTLVVLTWLYADSGGDSKTVSTFVEGTFWGIIPTLLFFAALWVCLRRGLPFLPSLGAGFGVWLIGACLHQYLLK